MMTKAYTNTLQMEDATQQHCAQNRSYALTTEKEKNAELFTTNNNQ